MLGRLAVAATLVLALAACSDSNDPDPTATKTPTTSAGPERITVRLGHCFVEPVTFAGKRWNVRFREQFGTGGLQPPAWRGRGSIELVSPDRAEYTDDGGAELVLLPVEHPAVRKVERAGCD